MLDQSFSVKNLRKIYDIENRKGNYLENLFPDELYDVKNITGRIKRASCLLRKTKDDKSKIRLKDYIKKAKKKKEEWLTEHMESISSRLTVSKSYYSIELGSVVHGKQTYKINRNIDNFFASKQIQNNLKSVFKVKQSSRNMLLSQLRLTLEDNLPKIIIKTDITKFYETIPHDKLLDVLNSNPLLNLASKECIKQTLHQYRNMTSGSVGIPRGVGISAYLSEIYMRQLDSDIKEIPNLIYFARYVDDIIMVFSAQNNSVNEILNKFDKICESLSIQRNASPTKTKSIYIKHGLPITKDCFEFLGYNITVSNDDGVGNIVDIQIKFDFSDKKKLRYKSRVKKAFRSYMAASDKERKASLLYSRIRFITSNTRLLNNKRNIIVGIYYSNRFLTELRTLDNIDRFFKNECRDIVDPILKAKLLTCSFRSGFDNKVYHKYSAKKLGKITKIWHYDENC